MSATINDGGPVHPTDSDNYGPKYSGPGISVRDHFAGLALQGLCANSGGPFQASARQGWAMANCHEADIASVAYALADAMLHARMEPSHAT